MCRIRQFLAVRRSFFHSSLLYTFSCHSSQPTDNSLPFSAASSIPLCYILFPATLLNQLFLHPPSLHFAVYFLVYLSNLLFPNSHTILFWEFYFLPFSVHAQTNVIYLTLLSLFFNHCIISLLVNILQFSFS